jgi:hypothetical protein
MGVIIFSYHKIFGNQIKAEKLISNLIKFCNEGILINVFFYLKANKILFQV